MENLRKPLQIILVLAGIVVIAASIWIWRETGRMSAYPAIGLMFLAFAAVIGNRRRRPRGTRPE